MATMTRTSFTVEPDLLEQLKEYAWKKKIPASEVIRRALREYLNRHGDRPYITRRIRVY